MSAIDAQLSAEERNVLASYRTSFRKSMNRSTRLSVQYAIGAGIFLALAISTDNPLWALPIYALFVVWMALRIRHGYHRGNMMSAILDKYDSRIRELEQSRSISTE